MPLVIDPSYQYFSSVEVILNIVMQDNTTQAITISKLGEHFNSLTIKEGSVGTGQFTPVINSDTVASGSVSLYDEDNAIFRALLLSKSVSGNQLLSYLDINLKTYTGERKYDNCKIDKWSVSFSNGIPSINIEWKRIAASSFPSPINNTTPQYDSTALNVLCTQGVKVDSSGNAFRDFKSKFNAIFNSPSYSFRQTRGGDLTQGTIEIDDSGRLGNDIITIPDTLTEPDANETQTYKFKCRNDLGSSNSVVELVMNEFCNVAQCGGNKISCIIRGNEVILFTFQDYNQRKIPSDGSDSVLDEVVFVYNSSLSQNLTTYRTPVGDRKPFIVTDLRSDFNGSDIIIANVNDQSQELPNGHAVITSRGRVMLPSYMPSTLTQAIQNLSTLAFNSELRYTITVYNFIHFQVCGDRDLYLVVFDHLGQVHPITGFARIEGYQYSLESGGVIRADVTLCPSINPKNAPYDTAVFLRDYVVTGAGDIVGLEGGLNPNTKDDSGYAYTANDMAQNLTPTGQGLNTSLSADLGIDYRVV